MTEQTQNGSDAQVNSTEQGTTENGQSGGQSNDPNAFQADYTKKYQALSDDRKAFEAEKQAFEQQKSQYQTPNQGYTTHQQPAQNAGYTQQPANNDQMLVDQYGYEGAQVLKQREDALINQFRNTQFQTLYSLEDQKGMTKYGEDWSKHNYTDQYGQQRNRVVDFRCCVNPMTGQTPTMEQAWHALNPVDPEKVKQQAVDDAHAQINKKDQSTPAQASTSNPQGSSQGHATTVAQAYEQAVAENS